MRFSYLTSLVFATAAIAAPTVSAPTAEIDDVTSVLEGYKTILSNANQQTVLAQGLKPGDDVIAVLKQLSTLSTSTASIVDKMNKDLTASPDKLSTSAAIKVAKPSGDVATATVTLINILVTKKDLFVKAGVHKLVLEDLNKVYKDANTFVDIAKTKIPDQYTALANQYFQQLLDSLQKGIKNFS